ncbi:MAG: RsmD family RNA methyltransferase, partial [Vicinamibacterales bacterium]
LCRDARLFNVIFLDPPFDTDPWDWLLPACAARLAHGGHVYAEANRALNAPAALTSLRQSRAGHVHYHLFGHASSA